jgi:hypothetical protein
MLLFLERNQLLGVIFIHWLVDLAAWCFCWLQMVAYYRDASCSVMLPY